MGDAKGVERRGYLVRGRVQGVGFRWWTRRKGQDLGLGGHVRNLPDGSVEVHAMGPASALDAFEAALRRGPPAASVSSVETIPADPRASSDLFEMERW